MTLAPVLNMASRYKQGLIPGASMHPNMSADQMIGFLDANPEIRKSAERAPGTSNRLAPKAMQVFLHWAFKEHDATLAKTFFIQLVTGEDKEIPSPIRALRSRLLNDKDATKKMGQVEKLALFIKAWNAVRSNRQVRVLSWGVGKEPFPAIM
jgi:hypothetical protein